MTLLEEPQAACYAWIDSAGELWRRKLRVGDLLLVCDIGGGTTDFSLILVGEHDGDLALERVAIGDHILLGGDNMDLALARVVQQRLEGEGHRIDTWQMQTLWHQCRVAKETLFAQPDQDTHPVTVLGKGTRLIGGTIRGELRRGDLNAVLVDGFFPRVAADEMPARRRLVGLQELGPPLRGGSRGDAPPGAISLPAGGRQPGVIGGSPRPERARLSDASSLQRRRHESRAAARADRRRAQRLADARGIRPARRGARARRAGSRPRRRARRGVLRAGTRERTRRSHPERRLAQLLHRHRERAAGGARDSRRR